MIFKRKPRFDADLDVSSFSDIAFLMIIFFILTTSLEMNRGRRMQMPSGSSQATKEIPQQLTVNLKGRTIQYGEENEDMTIRELRRALQKENLAARPEEERVVILDSGPDVPYELYFQVVTAISRYDGILALVDHNESK